MYADTHAVSLVRELLRAIGIALFLLGVCWTIGAAAGVIVLGFRMVAG